VEELGPNTSSTDIRDRSAPLSSTTELESCILSTMCAPCLSPMTWTTGMQSNNRNDCGGHRRSRCCSRLPGLLENMWWRNVVQSRKAYTIITMKLLQMTWTTGKTGINVTVVENTGRIDVGPDYLDYWKRTRGSTTCKWKECVFRDLDYWKIREVYCEGIVGL